MDDELMDLLSKHGYSSQRAVARALHEKVDYYRSGNSSLRTTTVFLNQVLLGKKPIPKHMADGLLSLCAGDNDLQDLLEKRAAIESNDSPTYHLTKVLDNYFDELRSYYLKADDTEKLEILSSFIAYVRDNAHIHTRLDDLIETIEGENK